MAKKKNRTLKEKQYLAKLVSLGCVACHKLGFYDTPSEVHHIRDGVGLSQRNDDTKAIPLCPRHHRHDKNAIHQSKVLFEQDFGTEVELLEYTLGLLNTFNCLRG